MAQWLKKKKNPPAKQETQIQLLGWNDPLEKEMAIHSSILVWEIPRTEDPGGLQSMALQKSSTQLGNQTTTTTVDRLGQWLLTLDSGWVGDALRPSLQVSRCEAAGLKRVDVLGFC